MGCFGRVPPLRPTSSDGMGFSVVVIIFGLVFGGVPHPPEVDQFLPASRGGRSFSGLSGGGVSRGPETFQLVVIPSVILPLRSCKEGEKKEVIKSSILCS